MAEFNPIKSDYFSKKMMSSNETPYNFANALPWEMLGSDFFFSHETNVLGLTRIILATSDCLSPAFTLAAARLILRPSNISTSFLA
jgi:hypothetical protein